MCMHSWRVEIQFLIALQEASLVFKPVRGLISPLSDPGLRCPICDSNPSLPKPIILLSSSVSPRRGMVLIRLMFVTSHQTACQGFFLFLLQESYSASPQDSFNGIHSLLLTFSGEAVSPATSLLGHLNLWT